MSLQRNIVLKITRLNELHKKLTGISTEPVSFLIYFIAAYLP